MSLIRDGDEMKTGDIVECLEFGMALVLGPVEVPAGVPEDDLEAFMTNPDAWPTEQGWAIQLLEEKNAVMFVHTHSLEVISERKE